LKNKHFDYITNNYNILKLVRMASVTQGQKLTALGLLAPIAGAFLLSGNIDKNYIIPAAITYGMGSAVSSAYYRIAQLLKNGKSELNEFGKGAVAGVTVFCSLLGLNAMPHVYNILTGDNFGMSAQSVLLVGGAFTILGFLQHRNSYLSFLDGSAENEQGPNR
jgi:hypothetical protein